MLNLCDPTKTIGSIVGFLTHRGKDLEPGCESRITVVDGGALLPSETARPDGSPDGEPDGDEIRETGTN